MYIKKSTKFLSFVLSPLIILSSTITLSPKANAFSLDLNTDEGVFTVVFAGVVAGVAAAWGTVKLMDYHNLKCEEKIKKEVEEKEVEEKRTNLRSNLCSNLFPTLFSKYFKLQSKKGQKKARKVMKKVYYKLPPSAKKWFDYQLKHFTTKERITVPEYVKNALMSMSYNDLKHLTEIVDAACIKLEHYRAYYDNDYQRNNCNCPYYFYN